MMVSSETSKFFHYMSDTELLDLETKPNKASDIVHILLLIKLHLSL